MKISNSIYYAVPTEDQSIYAYDFSDYIDYKTKTDYTLISIGSGTKVYELYDNIVLFWTELPNCLIHAKNPLSDYNKTMEVQNKFVKILTNCPFSVEYFNQKYNYDKFQYVFTPINVKYIPTQTEKVYDVFYTGHYSNPISFCYPILDKFNFCFVGRDWGKHRGVSYKEKLILNSKSKISIVHGLLNWPDISTKDLFPEHDAFKLIEHNIVPQIKTRTLEAAMSKSLILTLHDPWNIIESLFEPDEFVYWYDNEDLEKKIKHILQNYNDYIPMIEKAYRRVVDNYTTNHFFEKYLKNI